LVRIFGLDILLIGTIGEEWLSDMTGAESALL
jgi:hypothetical protein